MTLSTSGPHDPMIGQRVGGHFVKRIIGQGGMGTVYELEHPHIGKKLALKVLHPEYAIRPDIVARFLQEARSATLISHPNIVDVLDLNKLPDGRPYIMMEYLEGQSLKKYIHDIGPIPLLDVQEIALQIGSALQRAHERGIVHRDLKPENIFLAVTEESPRQVKILDFGIAKLHEKLGARSQTKSGAVIGTPRYMSPEQAMGKTREVDERTDIYALGVILYQMIAGEAPFRGQTFGELLLQHTNEPPPPLSIHRPTISPIWEIIVRKALEKKKEERYQTMAQFCNAIRDANTAAYTKTGPDSETLSIPSAAGGVSVTQTHNESADQGAIPQPITTETSSRRLPSAPAKHRRGLIVASVVFASLLVGGLVVWQLASAGQAPRSETTLAATTFDAGTPESTSAAALAAPDASLASGSDQSTSGSKASLASSKTSKAIASSSSQTSSTKEESSSSKKGRRPRTVRVRITTKPWGNTTISRRGFRKTFSQQPSVSVELESGKRYTVKVTNDYGSVTKKITPTSSRKSFTIAPRRSR